MPKNNIGENNMRTTIEISDHHRSILLSLAAKKGMRGYSGIIKEALNHYIECQVKSAAVKREILKMKGSWTSEETKKTKARLAEMRKNWERW
jgi:predicted DNA-binding protein